MQLYVRLIITLYLELSYLLSWIQCKYESICTGKLCLYHNKCYKVRI